MPSKQPVQVDVELRGRKPVLRVMVGPEPRPIVHDEVEMHRTQAVVDIDVGMVTARDFTS